MAQRNSDHDDYFDLNSKPKQDDFAIGEPISDYEEPEQPRMLLIVPLIMAFVVLSAVVIFVFVLRAWDRTPIPELGQQEVRVIEEPTTTTPVSTKKSSSEKLTVQPSPSSTPSNISAITTNNSPITNSSTSSAGRQLSEVLPELMPAIGMVVVRTDTTISSGSGFIINSDGLFVTNHHVIENAVEIAVKLNNSDQIHKADIVKMDKEKDLALLRFRESGSYPVLALEDSTPNLGEDILVLGYPLGTKLGLELTVSTGIVSSLRNYPEISLIQTNAAINHGNSGGPMIYRRTGKVVGVVTAKAKDSESIGFAINVKELKQLLER